MTNSVMKLMLADTENKNPLTFTAAEAGASVKLKKYYNLFNPPTIKYRTSYDKTWQDYTYNTTINLANVGDWVQFEGTESYLSINTDYYIRAEINKTVYASGELTSLIGYSKHIPAYCFYKFFQSGSSYNSMETHLLSAPSINADYAETQALAYLFAGQGGLTNIEINVDTVENNTLYFTFITCEHLKYVKLKSYGFVQSGECFLFNNNGFTIEVVKPLTSGLTFKHVSAPKNCTLICNADSYIKEGETIPDTWKLQVNSPGILLSHLDTKDVYSEAMNFLNIKYASSEPVENTTFNNLPENYSYEVTDSEIKISYNGGLFSSEGLTNDITLTLKSANFEKSTSFKFKQINNILSITTTEFRFVIGDGTEKQYFQYTCDGNRPSGIKTTLISGSLPNGVTFTDDGYFEANSPVLVDDKKVVRIKLESTTGNSIPAEQDITIITKSAQSVLNDESLTFYSTFNDRENYVSANVFVSGNNAVRTYKKTIDGNEVDYIEVGAFNTNDGFSNVIPIYQAILTGESKFINLNTGNVESTMSATINSQSGSSSGGDAGGGSASGQSLRITSSSVANGCAQVYSLTSGDPSKPPKRSNRWTFTGVKDSSWTVSVQYNDIGPDTTFVVYRSGAEMYHTTVGKEWVDLADAVANITHWMDSSSASVNMVMTVESGGESGGGSASGQSLRLTSSSVANGCAQVYNLTSGDPSTTPTNGSNSLLFTGVTDSTWTISIGYYDEFNSTGFAVKRDGASMYEARSDGAWVSLANAVANITYWMDVNTMDNADITLTVEESGGSSGAGTITISGCTTQMFNKEYSFNSAVPSYVPRIGNIMNVNGEISFGELSGKQYLEFLANDGSDRICNIYDADYWTKPTENNIPNITFSFSFCLFEFQNNNVPTPIFSIGQDKSLKEGVDIWVLIDEKNCLSVDLSRHVRTTLQSTQLNLNTWYNVIVTIINNKTIKCYLNGSKAGNDITRTGYKVLANSFIGINTRKLAYSGHADADEMNYFKYNNKMAFTNLRIYNKSFTENEIKILANEGI